LFYFILFIYLDVVLAAILACGVGGVSSHIGRHRRPRAYKSDAGGVHTVLVRCRVFVVSSASCNSAARSAILSATPLP